MMILKANGFDHRWCGWQRHREREGRRLKERVGCCFFFGPTFEGGWYSECQNYSYLLYVIYVLYDYMMWFYVSIYYYILMDIKKSDWISLNRWRSHLLPLNPCRISFPDRDLDEGDLGGTITWEAPKTLPKVLTIMSQRSLNDPFFEESNVVNVAGNWRFFLLDGALFGLAI